MQLSDLDGITAILTSILELLQRLEWWTVWVIGLVIAGVVVYFICKPIFYFIRK